MPAILKQIIVVAFLAASAAADSVTSTYTLLGPKCFPPNAPAPSNCKQTSNTKWGELLRLLYSGECSDTDSYFLLTYTYCYCKCKLKLDTASNNSC